MLIILWAVGSFWMAGCAAGRAEAKRTIGVDVSGVPDIVIEHFNGNIEIVTGAANRVEAEVTAYAPAAQRNLLDQLTFDFTADRAIVRGVGAWRQTEPVTGSVGLDMKLTVPAGSNLTVVLGNGNIRYDGTPTGETLYFEAGNGQVTLILPSTQAFRIQALIANGKFESDFPLGERANRGTVRVDDAVGAAPTLTVGATIGQGDLSIQQR